MQTELDRIEQIKTFCKRNRWYIEIGVRIALIITALFVIWYVSSDIKAFKILAYDPCQICMNKTGAICSYVPILPGKS